MNPDPNVIVEALRYYAESCSSRDVADGALPHAEAIAEMWKEMMTKEETLEALDAGLRVIARGSPAIQELIAAAREVRYIGGLDRLRAALKNLEEEDA